jgi:hypothetical protein
MLLDPVSENNQSQKTTNQPQKRPCPKRETIEVFDVAVVFFQIQHFPENVAHGPWKSEKGVSYW